MEKRALLAFILSFLVLFIWTLLFAPKQPQEKKATFPKKEPQKSRVESKNSKAKTKKRKEKDSLPERKIAVTERLITVETPLYRAVFSNIGPTIKSFTLKRYRVSKDPRSPCIELIELKDMGFLEFNIGGLRIPLSVYEPLSGNLEVSEKDPFKDLIFKGKMDNGIKGIYRFRFYPNRYTMDLSITYENYSSGNLKGPFEIVLRNRLPKKERFSSFRGFALFLDSDLKEIKEKELKKGKSLAGNIGWFAFERKFFMSAILPGNPKNAIFKGKLLKGGVLEGRFIDQSISTIPQGKRLTYDITIFMGPKDMGILKTLGRDLDKAINFGWTDIIAKPLLVLLKLLNRGFHNYGLSIIIMTILIKILFWPLTHKSYKSMKELQKIQPLMARIREKYKDNKEQLNRELMNLYKTYKVNPMSGCLPMIVQIPVFFALYKILAYSIELRHAPFILWIDDLSAPDRLFNFPFKIPLMAPPYGIPVLTLLMGASMYIQQKMTPTAGDPSQMKIMQFLPIIFTVMFINFPSGLVLYWLVNNVLSIIQQYFINKKITA